MRILFFITMFLLLLQPVKQASADDYEPADEPTNSTNDFILDADNSGGDITIQFGETLNESLTWNDTQSYFELSDALVIDGNMNVNGTIFRLDFDNSGVGADVDIVAEQGSDNDGTLRYSAANNRWEVSHDGGAFEVLQSASVAQVYESGTTTFNAQTAIDWDGTDPSARVVDALYSHATGLNPSQLTVNQTGLYLVSYAINWDTTSGGRRTATCEFLVNGGAVATGVGTTHAYSRNNTDDTQTNTSTFLYAFTSGDFYEIACSSTGTSGSITTLAGQSWTSIQRIRR